MQRSRLGFWQIWNMTFGFLGLQFGWALQMGNMSAIYEYLGANPHELPLLWLAAPLTGMVVQPLIGHASDATWGKLGRRRPYFLVGAVLSSTALVLMPHASTLWMAAGLLWIMDASINISMEPFRAFVADLLPPDQRTQGFAMQSLFIGLGGVLGSAMPYLVRRLGLFGAAGTDTAQGTIPATVRVAFYTGAAVFLAAVLWTVATTREHPPEDLEAFRREREAAKQQGPFHGAREIFAAVREMPPTMRQLAWVQISTWFGLFCMWLFFVPTVARDIFHAPNETSPLYAQGAEWGGVCFAAYSAVCFVFSLALPVVSQWLGRKLTHAICLICGALGLGSVAVIHAPNLLLLSMVGVGIAWASTLSMPYAILSSALPERRTGVYMGIFNFFITIPEISAAVGGGWVMEHVLHDNRLAAVVGGGGFMLLAATLLVRVRDPLVTT